MREREVRFDDPTAYATPYAPKACWSWVIRAHQAGGLALVVGLVVLRLCAMKGGRAAVELCVSRAAEEIGCDPKSIYRAVDRLAAAGLVAVDRRKGAWPLVRLKHNPLLKNQTKGKTK